MKRTTNPPYAKCEHCGATLDKGERCDCAKSEKEPLVRLVKTPEEEQEAADRRDCVIQRVGRRKPDPD